MMVIVTWGHAGTNFARGTATGARAASNPALISCRLFITILY
jgi:hypothetical protein